MTANTIDEAMQALADELWLASGRVRMLAKTLAAAPPADAEVWLFKGTDGAWRAFHSEQHRLDTIADGKWDVRKFTALTQQPEPKAEARGGVDVEAVEKVIGEMTDYLDQEVDPELDTIEKWRNALAEARNVR